jgi:hypothetical protein
LARSISARVCPGCTFSGPHLLSRRHQCEQALVHVLRKWLVTPWAEFPDGREDHVQATPLRDTSSRSIALWSTVAACSTSRCRMCGRARFPSTIAFDL